MNRIASLAILPLMTLAIVVFSRFADDSLESSDPPPDSGTLVVANLRTEVLSFVNLADGEIRTLHLPGPPHEMVEAGGRLYVTLGRGNALLEIEPGSGSILRVLEMEGEPHGIAVYGENLVVTLDKANVALVIDRRTLTELRRYDTGETPHTVAVSPGSIVVTDSRDNALRQLEPESMVVAAGQLPEAIAIAGAFVVSADAQSGTVTIARLPGLEDPRAFKVGRGPVRVTRFDNETVLVALQGDDRIAHVELSSGRVLRRMPTGERPDGLCVAPDNKYLGAASNADGTFDLFSTGDWRSVSRLNLEPGLGACIWL